MVVLGTGETGGLAANLAEGDVLPNVRMGWKPWSDGSVYQHSNQRAEKFDVSGPDWAVRDRIVRIDAIGPQHRPGPRPSELHHAPGRISTQIMNTDHLR